MTLDWRRSLFGGKFTKFSADSVVILSFLKVIYSARKLSSNFRSNFLPLCPYSYANFHFLTLVLSDWVEFVKCSSKNKTIGWWKSKITQSFFFQSQFLIKSNFPHIQTKLQHSTLTCKFGSLKNQKMNKFLLISFQRGWMRFWSECETETKIAIFQYFPTLLFVEVSPS